MFGEWRIARVLSANEDLGGGREGRNLCVLDGILRYGSFPFTSSSLLCLEVPWRNLLKKHGRRSFRGEGINRREKTSDLAQEGGPTRAPHQSLPHLRPVHITCPVRTYAWYLTF